MSRPTPASTRAQILTDLRAGNLTHKEIAAQHGLARTSVSRIARQVGLSRPSGRAKRPLRHCLECGSPTVAKNQTCRNCYHLTRCRDIEPAPEHALVGGTWRPDRRGIQRWVTQ